MKEEIADKWIEALESGKYKQGHHALKREDGYCCLGVLCDISGQGRWNRPKGYISSEYAIRDSGNANKLWLPDAVREWAGMRTCSGDLGDANSVYFGERECGNLSALNDAGASFKDIVAVIKQNWEEL